MIVLYYRGALIVLGGGRGLAPGRCLFWKSKRAQRWNVGPTLRYIGPMFNGKIL